ncbi:MAG TPA: penicillin-binding protein 2 [Nakamurella sp.]|jgi:peptidoglycan glycosyltransferase|nr:penicillin-binding protein 2 [Nakamurella sp.]
MRRLGMAVIVMIAALLANLTYIQVFKSVAYRNDPNNKRTVLEEYSRARGQITAAGGVVLAKSTPSDDQYRYQRSYPGGAMYANLTGYYSLRYGPTGLERLQNDLLSGDDPELWVDRLSDLITGRDPAGGNVQLTIVPAVQKAAYNGLASKGYVGAVVAIKPSTGEILAMASTPSYDPDPLASHSEKTQKTAYNKIIADSPSPILDRTIGAVYPPGSTFKLVVTAAALQHGYTPTTSVTGAPTITLPGTRGATLSNFDHETCGNAGGSAVSLTTALAYSCNTAYASVAMQVGRAELAKQAAAFGVDGQDWSLDGFPVAGSRTGEMADDAAVAQSGIGQRDVALTPLQDAIVAATIANHGERMQPFLIAKTTRPDLSVIKEATPTSQGQAVPSAVADEIRDMMVQAEKATPGSGQISGLTIASKTGTAEHGTDPKSTPPHCWYVAFAPADDPQVAVAVLVTNGGDRGLDATGATVAGPIGRSVIAAALAGSR